ncbi:hypothetical protein GF342_01230 [Candidatus Woesearchaeota archaeon]|nr:hypothetical protein [Candidatus Woesearchaeota archaeon]
MARKSKTLRGTSKSDLERALDKVLVWFYGHPETDFTLSELCTNLEISKTTANTIVNHLESIGFLTKQVLGKVWRIRANPSHDFFITKKIPFNLQSVYECGVLQWIATNIPNARAVILFGSYRNGDDTEQSDIDIAVEVLSNQEIEIIPLHVKALGYRTNVPLNVHVFSRNKIDLNVFANIANGILLKGFLEVRP